MIDLMQQIEEEKSGPPSLENGYVMVQFYEMVDKEGRFCGGDHCLPKKILHLRFSWSTQAAIRKYYRQDDLNNRHLLERDRDTHTERESVLWCLVSLLGRTLILSDKSPPYGLI